MSYPDNGAYMVSAYVVTAVIVLAYTALLVYRGWKIRTRQY